MRKRIAIVIAAVIALTGTTTVVAQAADIRVPKPPVEPWPPEGVPDTYCTWILATDLAEDICLRI